MIPTRNFFGLGLVCFLFSAVPVFAAGTTAPNLLKDGSFEDTTPAWALLGTASITTREAHSGKQSLFIKGDPKVKAGETMPYCGVPGLKPGQFYRVDAWSKTKGLEKSYTVVSGPYMDDYGSFLINQDDHDWEQVTGFFRAKNDTPFRLYLLGNTGPAGEAFFDDVSLRECDDPTLKPVTFEDGTMFGVGYCENPDSIARVVKMKSPQGDDYCLSVAPASCVLSLTKPVTSGLAEFSFLVNLKGSGTIAVGNALRLDFLPGINNYELKDGQVVPVSLGTISPNRWYRFRGIINLDNQTYDLEVTDYEDELGSFTRKGLHFIRQLKEAPYMYLVGNTKNGVFFDDVYLGPVREK